MLLMIKNHLNGTWFYELLNCYFRVYPIVVFSKKSEFLRIEKTGEKWT